MILTIKLPGWIDPDGRQNTLPIIGVSCRVDEQRVVCRRLAALALPEQVFTAEIWDGEDCEIYDLVWPKSLEVGYHREVVFERAR